jgi:alanine dehydrogenase
MSESPMMSVTVTVGEASTDAAEVARRLAAGLPVTDFDRERLARILDRLSEELAEAATNVRRAR